MIPILAILKALVRAVRRETGTFESIKLNNLFLFIALMVWGSLESGLEPVSAEPLIMLLGVLLLFPLSSDPLGKIPPDRFASWPIPRRSHFVLRIASLALSPAVWLSVAALIFTRKASAAAFFLALAAGIQAVRVLASQTARRAAGMHPLRQIPQLPGKIGGLVRNNLRQMLSVLDTYAAILLAVGGTAYRFLSPRPDPASYPILAMLVGVSLSTYAQCLFSLDLESSGMARYRLLPLRGWEILLAKDIAWLAILILLSAPLDLTAGLIFGLTALAIGHHPSVRAPSPQLRWRFTGGRVLPGVLQCAAGFALGSAVHQHWFIAPAAALAFAASVYVYGRVWDSDRPSK